MIANVKYCATRRRNYNSLREFVNKKAATLLFATFWVKKVLKIGQFQTKILAITSRFKDKNESTIANAQHIQLIHEL